MYMGLPRIYIWVLLIFTYLDPVYIRVDPVYTRGKIINRDSVSMHIFDPYIYGMV